MAAINDPAPRWGTLADAAEHLAVDQKTIRRMAADGRIEAFRFGTRMIRVNLNSLDRAGRPLQYVEVS